MHLLPYDYGTMVESSKTGLFNLVPHITSYQADDVPTLLFDTGDFLQGSPLADFAMHSPNDELHPIARVFNTLRYDAVILGNHDFDYGLGALETVIDQTNCPVLAANVAIVGIEAPYAATTMLKVSLAQDTVVLVGVIGLTTPTIGLLDKNGSNRLTATPPYEVAKQTALALRQQGADLIIALCHFGIEPADKIENIAVDIASIAEINVVMAGHTHDTFPEGSPHQAEEINQSAGTIHGKPTVMAGAFGQHLGVIELDLSVDQKGTSVIGHDVSLVTPQDETPAEPKAFAEIQSLHDQTLQHMGTTIAHTILPFSTEFSLIQPDLTQYLLSCARQLHIEDLIADTSDADLPILTTAAPYRTGSRSDPVDFITLPPGPITRTDVAAIYPFHNSPIALRRNAAQIKDWLEDAALLFHQLVEGESVQELIDPRIPPYRFDTIFGLTYQIDATAPPGQRISDIKRKGIAVSDTDMFVLVTSSNRLNRGQNIPSEDVICIAQQSSQDILIQSLQRQSPVTVPCPHVWDFKPMRRTKAQFYSSVGAVSSTSQRRLHDDGITTDGFRQFTINFDPQASLARQ